MKGRGFLKPRQYIKMKFEERRWQQFSKYPKAAIAPVVREFYANAKEHKDKMKFVHGKLVPSTVTLFTVFMAYKMMMVMSTLNTIVIQL